MTFRQALKSWCRLCVAAALAGFVQLVVSFAGARPLAELSAPTHVPLTAQEAQERHGQIVQQWQQYLASYKERCGNQIRSIFPKGYADCLAEGEQEFRNAQYPPLAAAYEAHERAREADLDERERKLVRGVFPWLFGVAYAYLALLAIRTLARWFLTARGARRSM